MFYFCVEGFVRSDPLDDGGSGNTMFFDFGLRLMARQATNTRAVTLEGTPVGSTLTYNPGTDRTVPTERFIHFAITRKSSIINLWRVGLRLLKLVMVNCSHDYHQTGCHWDLQ